jgi:hypothetical protein
MKRDFDYGFCYKGPDICNSTCLQMGIVRKSSKRQTQTRWAQNADGKKTSIK